MRVNNDQNSALRGQHHSLGSRCRTPVTWDNPVNRIVLGPELLKEMEQEVVKIKHNLKAA